MWEHKIGWSQGYPGLKFHMVEALSEDKDIQSYLQQLPPQIEANVVLDGINNPPLALFSKKYYNDINSISGEKKYDYCFIGSIKSNNKARQWVIEFAKKHFTNNSVFLNTDKDISNWKLLGDFDYTGKIEGFVPKNDGALNSKNGVYREIHENLFYFTSMKQSKYVLCPAGDTEWSFRFYETIMCKSIPIVESWHHTYRNYIESSINFKYILYQTINSNFKTSDDNYNSAVKINTLLFEKNFMWNKEVKDKYLILHVEYLIYLNKKEYQLNMHMNYKKQLELNPGGMEFMFSNPTKE